MIIGNAQSAAGVNDNARDVTNVIDGAQGAAEMNNGTQCASSVDEAQCMPKRIMGNVQLRWMMMRDARVRRTARDVRLEWIMHYMRLICISNS